MIVTEKQDCCIAFQFRDVARKYPDFPAIINDQGAITYAQLLATVVLFAKKMQGLGVGRNSVVALNTGDMPVSLSTMLATSLLGCQFVIAGKILARQDVVEPTHFFNTSDAKGKRSVNFVEIDETWIPQHAIDPFNAVEEFPGCAEPEDPWMILHTSGTTGRPKFISLSQRIVSDRTAAIADDFPTAGMTCAMLFNSTSRPFFARALGVLLNACTIVDSYDTDLWKRSGVGTVFGSPGQLEEFISDRGIHGQFKTVEVSGAKLTNDLARTLSGYFETIVDIYGASETNKTFSSTVHVADTGEVVRIGQKLGSAVEIVDADGNRCEPDKVGAVRVKNTYMVDGYLNADAKSEKAFKDGWFYPGDIATWGPNGELDVIGRNDEIISFGGVKIDAQLIDLIIKSTAGVKDAVSFRNPKPSVKKEVLAFIVFGDGANKAACVANIRENYQNRTGLPCYLGRLHEIDAVPYNSNGRPLRALCAEMVLMRSGEIVEIDD